MPHRSGANQQLGGKLGPRLASMLSEVLTSHLRDSGTHRAELVNQGLIRFFRTITRERDSHWAPIFEELLKYDELPPEVRRMLQFSHKGSGEGAAMGALSTVTGLTQTTLGTVFGVLLEPLAHKAHANHPYVLLDPGTIAQLIARGFIDQGEAESESLGSGLDARRLYHLTELARIRPSIDVLTELHRRGIIGAGVVEGELRAQGFSEEWWKPFVELTQNVLSPEDLALMVLKGIRSEDETRGEAAMSGIDEARYRDLILMTGEPPGPEQLGEALRRGIIDEQRFEHGIRESRIRNEWTPVLKALRFQRASPSDALRGVVQGHLSNDEGKKIAEENGLDPRDWEWLHETEGNPAATMQMVELWRRGLVSKGEVEQAIREGRTKNKYIPHLLHLKRALPSIYQINTMVKAGTIGDQEAARLLHELGYESDVVTSLIHAQTTAKPAKEKALARGEVQELYYDHAIDEAQALKLLRALGYTGQTASFVLAMVDLRRERALRAAAMSPIRSAFIAHRITEPEAKMRLDALHVPPNQRDMALALWNVDREANHKTLTAAEIVKANAADFLGDTAAESRLMQLGYSHIDSQILLDLEKGRKKAAP